MQTLKSIFGADFQVTAEMISVQIQLSKIINLAEQLEAGVVDLQDICNFNRKTTSEQLALFLTVMEVYGSSVPAQSMTKTADYLYEARLAASDQLQRLKTGLD